MDLLQTIIIAIVEGITEFLPVSSTGHMIIAQKLLGVESSDFVKMFTVCIQFGAILSVIILYWKKFFQTVNFYLKLFVGVLPAVIFGFLFKNYIDALLENVIIVAITLVLGGIVLIFVDKWFKTESEDQEVTYPKALKIGLFQVVSMIPGVSRSAATIIGGLAQKLSRKNAAEFSFFLAVPTMFGASALELFETYKQINTSNIQLLIVGNIVAFIVALIAIKGFISYLTQHGFKLFGYYRIIIGLLILILLAFGVDLNMMG
jgi:undecaprenyl-diphosphatase